MLFGGRPRFPLVLDTGEFGGIEGVNTGVGGAQAEHCHDPSGMDSRPTQYVW